MRGGTVIDLAPGERIEWTVPEDLPDVHVLRVDNCARRWQVFHETYTICAGLAISEPAGWKYRGRVHHQTADGLQLIEPGEVHRNTKITAPASFRVAMIDAGIVAAAARELGMKGGTLPHLHIAQMHGGPVHAAFVALHSALEHPATPLERQTRFADCLRLMLEHCAESAGPRLGRAGAREIVLRARAFIDEHHAEAIRLDQLVTAAGQASRFHLVHAFTAAVGLPPHAYQLQVRVSRARRLLASGMPSADVAMQLGFADQSHFARHFRRVTGVTPGRYASERRRGAKTF
jgi:AraC-like DNA-binding protein